MNRITAFLVDLMELRVSLVFTSVVLAGFTTIPVFIVAWSRS